MYARDMYNITKNRPYTASFWDTAAYVGVIRYAIVNKNTLFSA